MGSYDTSAQRLRETMTESERVSARRVVAIQERLVTETMAAEARADLIEDQRGLWDRFHTGRPFETIARMAQIVA